MNQKKVLILYAARGSGHEAAAKALASAFETNLGWGVHCDSLMTPGSLTPPIVKFFYQLTVAKTPYLWNHVYNNRFYFSMIRRLEPIFYKRDYFHLKEMIRRHNPHVIVATHALALRALAGINPEHFPRLPIFAVPTDFLVHRYWAASSVDAYLTASEEAARNLCHYGVDASRIRVIGLPIAPAFARLPGRAECRRRLGCGQDKFFVLVMGGRSGFFPYSELLEIISQTSCDYRIEWIFLTGESRRMAALMTQRTRLNCDRRVRLIGYTDKIDEYMAAADLIVTKAGGLTLAEAFSASLGIIISRPLPGQEIFNARHLARHQAVLWIDDLGLLMERVKSLLTESGQHQLKRLRDSARLLARPNAAGDIVRFIGERLS
ncbi:MAG: hypothetical protein HY547_05575 [Elusimicrobia bacterium]|nr:hypothetical protein [Elusimicrobiota bacterium]